MFFLPYVRNTYWEERGIDEALLSDDDPWRDPDSWSLAACRYDRESGTGAARP